MSGYNTNETHSRKQRDHIKRQRSSFSPESLTTETSIKKSTRSHKRKEPSSYMNSSTHPKVHKNSALAKDLEKLQKLINPPSETSVLKDEVKELKHTVKKQNKALNDLCTKIVKERKEIKVLTGELLESKKKDELIVELNQKLESMQNNEIELVNELDDQIKQNEDLVQRMQEIETETKQEIENARKKYKEHYSKKLKEEMGEYKEKIQELEQENEKLRERVKELEQVHEMEMMGRSVAANEANAFLAQLEGKTREIDILKEELRRMREQLREKSGEQSNRELRERLLTEEKAKDERQIEGLQEKIKELANEAILRDDQYLKMEAHYKEKMETAARIQEQRKKEWVGIYNELLVEVRQLKEGMDLLEAENRRLLSNMRSPVSHDTP